jgi:hypothetical protein
VSFRCQPLSAADFARAALAELVADEPDRSPAHLLAGDLVIGDSWVKRVEAARDPVNAPAMRPHVIAACEQLVSHPTLALHCCCGRRLSFLALGTFALGVLVVSSPGRLPPKLRQGGARDLAPINDHEQVWTFDSWAQAMRCEAGQVATSWRQPMEHPVLGPGAGVVGDETKRLTFRCEKCVTTSMVYDDALLRYVTLLRYKTYSFHNVTLLRYVLQAIADGEREVRLARLVAAAT